MTSYKRKEIIGNCELYLGDCLEVMKDIGEVDAVVTDPPYGIGFKYNEHKDDESLYPEFMKNIVYETNKHVNEGGLCFWWQSMKHCSRYSEWFPDNFRIFAAVRNFTQFLPTPIQYSWDPVVWYSIGKTKRRSFAGQRDYHIGNTAKYVTGKDHGHPCPRPLDTVEYIIQISSDKDNIIFDPFMGSGTAGIACVNLDRKFIGIELDETYFDIACKRIEKATKDYERNNDVMDMFE